MKHKLPLIVGIALALASAGYSQQLSILNPSFELGSSTASGNYSQVSAPSGVTDWTISNSGSGSFLFALINIPGQSWTGPSQGTNAFQLYAYGSASGSAYIYQTLTNDFVAGDIYTLTADGQAAYTSEIYVGTNSTPTDAVASQSFLTSPGTVFTAQSLSFTATAADAGNPISIGFYIPSIGSQGATIDNFQLLQSLPATSYLWSNAPASSNWSAGANWAGGLAPSTGSALTFGPSTITTLNNDIVGSTNASLTFSNNAPAYTIGGNTLTLTGLNAGIFNSSSNTQTINTPIVIPSSISLATTNGGGNLVINGPISGAGGVTPTGSGTVTLGGPNTYTGTTTIGSNNSLALTGSISNSAITVSSGSLQESSAGVIAGTSGIAVSGSNSVVNLAGNNSFTGQLNISAGSVVLSGNNTNRPSSATGAAPTAPTYLTGGSLTLQANSNNTVGGISYAMGPESSAANAFNFTFTGGTLNLLSDSNVTFAGGNGMGIYQGGTTISFNVDGLTPGASNKTITFAPNGTGGLANTTVNVNGSGDGYTLAMGTHIYSGLPNVTYNVNGASLDLLQIDGNGGGVISGGTITKNGSGTLILSGNNTNSSENLLLNGGDTVLTGSLSNSAVSLQGGNFEEGTTTIAGTKGLTIGSGTASLDGLNTYSGGTVISGGELDLVSLPAAVSTIGSGTLSVSGGLVDLEGGTLTNALVSSGGTIQDGAITNSGAYTLQGGTIIADLQGTNGLTMNGSNNTLTLVGPKSLTGGLTVTAGTLAGDTVSLAGDITNNGNVDFIMTNNGTYTPVSNGITGTGSVSVDGNGTSTLTLAGNNSYSGGTTVNTNGILLIQTTSSIGSGSLTIAGGTANLNGLTITNGFSASGGVVTNGTILGNGGSFSVSGGTIGAVLAGSNSLTVIDPNTVILTANNTYSGGTFATGGTLDLTNGGTIGSGTLTVSGDAVVDLGGGLLTNELAMSAGTIQNGTLTNSGPYVLQGGTVAATLEGTHGLTMNGVSNTLTLVGPQSYTGGTTVSAGTLAGDTTSIRGDIVNNGAIDFVTTTNGTYTGTSSGITGTGSVIADGSATLTLGGSNSYSGGTIVTNNGSLQLASTHAIGSGTLTAAGGTLDLGGFTITNAFTSLQGTVQNGTLSNNSGTFILQGGEIDAVLAGSSSVTVTGPGQVTLGTNNSYTGGTFATNGTLQLTTPGSIGSGQLNISGVASVDLGGNTYSNTLSMSGGTLQDGTITNSGAYILQGGTISATLEGTHGLTMNGASNTLTLVGPQSLTGGLTVSAGTLAGDTTSLTGDIVNNGSVDFVMTTNGTYTGTSNGITGTGSVIADGSATLTLAGNNSYSGGTIVTNNGALQLTSTQNIGSGTVTVGGGTLNLGGLILTNAFTASGGDVTNGTISNSSGYILQGGEIDAVLAGSGSLTVAGPGTVILTQTNTYSGGTYATGGTLQLTNGGTLGSGNLNVSGATVDLGGGTLTALGSMSAGTIQDGVITNSGAYVFQGGTISANLEGTGGLTMDGTTTLTLSGSNSYTGGNTVSSGTLAFANSNAFGSNNALTITGTGTADLGGTVFSNTLTVGPNATIQNGTVTNSGIYNLTGGTYNVVLEGSNGLTMSGNGTLTLGQANTYTGGTTLNGGTVAFINPNTPLGTGTVTFASNSTLFYQGTTAAPTVGMPNAIVLNSGVTATVNPGTNSGAEMLLGGPISGPGALSIETTSLNNTVTFDNDSNSYTGGTTLNGGLIQIVNSGNLVPFGSGTVTVAGTTDYKDILSYTLTNSVVINAGATLGIFNQSSAAWVPTFSGTISGRGSLTLLPGNVAGFSTILSGNNTYTGTTTISSGTLILASGASISGSTNINLGTAASQGTLDVSSNATYTFNSGQTISGYGLIKAGSIDVAVNGNITPGSIDGTTRGVISVNGNLELGSSAVTTLTLNSTNGGAGTGYDAVDLTGSNNTLVYNGTLDLVINSAPEAGTFNLFGASSYSGNFNNVLLAGSWNPGAFTESGTGIWVYSNATPYTLTFNPSLGQLVVAVPEPSTWTLLGVGLLLGCLMRRKVSRRVEKVS